MARFSGDPLKNPLTGNEFIPFTDPSTGNDGSCNPSIVTQFVAQNMAVAAGSSNGLIDAASYAKLQALPTDAVLATQIGELAQVAIPIFFASPSNSTAVIYQHVLTVPWQLKTLVLFTSAGSTNVQITNNGNPVTWAPAGTTIPATTGTAGGEQIASGTGGFNVFQPGDQLGIVLSGTTGNCANLAVSILATAIDL
jgi:hypothetical protein